MNKKIAIIGAGSFGTTLSVLLGEKGYNVHLWVREKELLDEITSKHENLEYLKGIKIPDNVTANNSLQEVVKNSDFVINAVPSEFTREIAKKYKPYTKKNCILINVAKGMETNGKTMSHVLEEELSKDVQIVSLSGPNHAEELSKKKPTATVIASKNFSILQEVKELFQTEYFKVFPHDDILGIEVCGAIKNIAAIATGVSDGLGYGDNARASIITLGLMEMSILGNNLGAKRTTFYGLAGVGDLVATCTSLNSRNRFVGEKLARGLNLRQIKEEMHGMIAEGLRTCKFAHEFAKKQGLEMPLTKQVYHVLYEKKNIKEAIKDLLNYF